MSYSISIMLTNTTLVSDGFTVNDVYCKMVSDGPSGVIWKLGSGVRADKLQHSTLDDENHLT
jgi:hypothetical protein